MLEHYAEPGSDASSAQAMETDELIAYLRNTDNSELSPMESVLAQTESIGDPATATADQAAILNWVGESFSYWEQQFPLDQPLACQLRRLKPLAAALAITDQDFFTPGAHPLHTLLDTIQLGAIGWQSRLGRAGQALEKQVVDAVNAALTWFDAPDVDLAAICAEVASTIEREQARASRMAQRLIETEQGRIRNASAKRQAASMINASLKKYPVPPGIGEFLKGPWYDSAQLVLLKFGEDSEQWRQMSEITHTLVDSLHIPEAADESRRQYIFETITALPKELKRWLLSLQHDRNSIDEAVGIVEFSHLRVLRQQTLDMQQMEPIPVVDSGPVAAETDAALASIEPGQWFSLDTAQDGHLRVRLALRMDGDQQLLFSNQAGVKALQLGLEDFSTLLREGKAQALDSGASFSKSLTQGAGIATKEDLDAFTGEAAEKARLEQARLQREREEAERLQREREEAERLQREREEAERLQQEREEAERLQREREEAERLQQEREEAERLQQEREQAQRPQQESEEAQNAAPPVSGRADIDLPMGAWLGFHDGDTPLMAKLAVHDIEQDAYIFVNRNGIKMRQLSKKELLALMDGGLVDILETRSNFRDEISRVRNESED